MKRQMFKQPSPGSVHFPMRWVVSVSASSTHHHSSIVHAVIGHQKVASTPRLLDSAHAHALRESK